MTPKPFGFSPTRVPGNAKNTRGEIAPATDSDLFGLIRSSYVITVLASEQFGIGTIQVQNDTLARRRRGLPPTPSLTPKTSIGSSTARSSRPNAA